MSDRLRVTWIVPGFSSDEKDWCIPALLDLAREISARCRLTVVSMRYPYRRDDYTVAGARVISIGGGHRGLTSMPGVWNASYRTAGKLEADVVHAFWAYEPGVIAAWLSSRLPVVISLAGGELADLPRISYGLSGALRTRIPVHWAMRRARVVTCGSPFLLELARRTARCRDLRFHPLGIMPERWRVSPPEGRKGAILNVGSLQPVKGHDVLLKAFREARRAVPSARLRIVGDGREMDRLIRFARELGCSDVVEFSGHVRHEHLPSVYGSASLFVQSSWFEAQGMAVLESAASGLPIVGTEVGALTHLSPSAARAVSAGDTGALAQAMIAILDDPGEAARLANAARELALDFYSVKRCADRFTELYASLA